MQLAYLPDRKREYVIDDDALSMEGKGDVTNIDELVKDYKRNRRRGMLGWFKLRVSSLVPLANDFNVNFDLFML
jgi:centromeric protein E